MPPSSSPSPSTLLFFFLLITLPFFVNSQSIINQEQTVLLNIKQQWNNPPALDSWNPSTLPHCNWTGITCNTDGSITQLTLKNVSISEQIPPSICDLENLTFIDLSYNLIPGEFPTSLYNCSKLQYLDLSQNFFVGRIPNDINRFSSLEFLNIGANNFTGDIPASLGSLQTLKALYMFQNQFKGSFPPEIGNLSNLEELGVAYNSFIPWQIPKEFSKLKNLWYLWMTSSNLIGEIPVEVGEMINLEWLDLQENNLTGGIPDNLFLLKNLTVLYLAQNNLTGEIPKKIESMKLREIDLSINKLTGSIPEDFGKLDGLEQFDLYANRLSGEIPASIGRLPSLKRTRLFRNNLTGILPPDFGLNLKLEEIEVSENKLTGSLPENICAGGVLTGLVAFSNNLTGGLPKSLESCDSLMSIQIYNNRFSGEVSAGFWSLTNLSTVLINNNSFSGELPNKLSWNLTRLAIQNNRFSGRIPSNIMASENLMVFSGSNNLFSGEIPGELTGLSKLTSLTLDRNQLSGPIPEKIISWSNLNTLDLSWNQLSGNIPREIGILPDLNSLDLSNNQLSGPVPEEIGRMRLSSLNLSSNQLSGRLPADLDNSVYETSFLNNTKLCSNKNSGSACATEESRSSRRLNPRLLAMILTLSGAALLVLVFFAILAFRDYNRRKEGEDLTSYKLTSFQTLEFTESKILSNLTENNLIGSGGSGKVYRVNTNNYRSSEYNYVAVKKIWNTSKIDQKLEKEFQAEVQILGTIRHSNIVKLLCYISNGKSKFLVYEYMQNRSLDGLLHGLKRGSLATVLDWPKRLHIAVGAARGLSYMHHNCSPPIIHRDIKSSNILLDSEFNAKIADFGLAKMLSKVGASDAMSVVAGTFGYMAPEYAHTIKVNEKIDVYSFGVVLLELATGREAKEGDEHTSLAEWAWRHFQEGNTIESALDEEVKEPCYLDEMSMVFKLGLMCTGTLPTSRPSMKEVLQILVRDGSLQAYREKIAQLETDVAPLLSVGKGSQKKRNPSLDKGGDCDSFACNV